MKKLPLYLKQLIDASNRIIVLLVVTLIALFTPVKAQAEPENAETGDMLLYVSDDYQLISYSPVDRTETIVLEHVRSFVPSSDGRIAFTRQDENDSDIYIFDPSTPAIAPINISRKPAATNVLLAWSPGGRYLAFDSYEDDHDHSLYVWSSEETINVMPDHALDKARTFYVDWSQDERLAFTVRYGWTNLDIPSELYLWDGNTTANLSQNPTGYDSTASWSKTGKLMFYSTRNDVGGAYVWDGVTFAGGSPDFESVILFDKGWEPNAVTWTNEGFVAYETYTSTATSVTKEIILWDPEQEEIVQSIPVSSKNAWSQLSEDGKTILSSHLASGLPSYYLDVENTAGEILFNTTTGEFDWSLDGYLAYCRWTKDRTWILSLWDGRETWDVASVSYKPARWLHGKSTFSCNNG